MATIDEVIEAARGIVPARRALPSSVRVIRKSKRLRSWSQLAHQPNGHGRGKWQNKWTYRRYKMKARRLRKIAADSRRRNR